MSRIVMAGMPAAGHLNPSLPLVREVVRRGVDVTYCTADEFREQVERTGAEFRPYPAGTISPDVIARATREGGPTLVVARILQATETLVPFLRAELREREPDAVMFDSNAVWAHLAARSLGLRRISFMTTMTLGSAEMRRLTAREWFQLLREAAPQLPQVRAARRRVQRRFGGDDPRPSFPVRGDLTLFPIPRWLQPDDPLVDTHSHFLGPTIDPDGRREELDPELADHVAGPEPVVLVSLGTLHAGSAAFWAGCFQALGDLPARVVLAVGARTDVPGLGPVPANTLVRPSVPQLELLLRASAFVTHGGMNSVLEGLHPGVPLVVVPQQVEQLAVGLRVADRGAAAVLRQHLSGRSVPPARLRSAVRGALDDPGRRAAAEALAATLDEGGAVRGASVIQRFLADGTT